MLTLVVFAITSTAICFMDGKDWFYHRLPATVATVLALLCWAASALVAPPHGHAAGPSARAGWRCCLRGLPGRGVSAPGTAGRAGGRAGAEHRRQAGAAYPPAEGAHLYRLFGVDRAGLSGGEQHRRRLGFALQFDVGAERRAVARPLRCRRSQGVADPPLGCARLHRRLPGHRGGRHGAQVSWTMSAC